MVRLAIAGIGSIANMYIWLIASGKVPSVRLTALCSRSREAMEQAANRFHLDVKLYQDYEELLSSGDCDAVLICTPHGKHPTMTKQALLAGIPVLVEKPVGIFTEEVEECLDILKKDPKLVCGVMYNRRASKAFHAIKKMVDSGEIGELVRCSWIITDLYRSHAYHASSPWRGSWAEEGGGLLMTQASHQLDLLQWICGMPVAVTAHVSNDHLKGEIEVEDTATALFETADGRRLNFFATTACGASFPAQLHICTASGEKLYADTKLVLKNRVPVSADEADGAEIGKAVWGKGHALLIKDFYSCLASGKHFPIDAAEAAKVIRLILAMYESNGERIEIR